MKSNFKSIALSVVSVLFTVTSFSSMAMVKMDCDLSKCTKTGGSGMYSCPKDACTPSGGGE